jgi:hypothetical protein
MACGSPLGKNTLLFPPRQNTLLVIRTRYEIYKHSRVGMALKRHSYLYRGQYRMQGVTNCR